MNIVPITSNEIVHYTELKYLLTQNEFAEAFEVKREQGITAQVLLDLLMERVKSRQDFFASNNRAQPYSSW